jgi:hypothetical protein
LAGPLFALFISALAKTRTITGEHHSGHDPRHRIKLLHPCETRFPGPQRRRDRPSHLGSRQGKKALQSFESATRADPGKKEELVAEICTELNVHATIEEEIFYPAVREALEERDLLDEAEVEHVSAKELIAQLEDMKPGDAVYDAR